MEIFLFSLLSSYRTVLLFSYPSCRPIPSRMMGAFRGWINGKRSANWIRFLTYYFQWGRLSVHVCRLHGSFERPRCSNERCRNFLASPLISTALKEFCGPVRHHSLFLIINASVNGPVSRWTIVLSISFHSELECNRRVESRLRVLSEEISLVVANPLLQTLPIERNFLSMPCIF